MTASPSSPASRLPPAPGAGRLAALLERSGARRAVEAWHRARTRLRTSRAAVTLGRACAGVLSPWRALGDRRGTRLVQAVLERHVAPAAADGRWEEGRVLMVCGTLGGGGAERQLVNTALGLVEVGAAVPEVLGQHLWSEERNLHRPALEAAGIRVSQVAREARHWPTAATLAERVAWARIGLSRGAVAEIRAFAAEIGARRPATVHTWLDEVNVKAGLAALAAGVPRLVVGVRSLSPPHFAFYRSYMRFGYLVLARSPRVALVANSEAGARDYERWLGLPAGRFRVVRNGLSAPALEPPAPAEVQAWRARHGLAGGAPVVGTVARFSEEKRPGLWVRVAAEVARREPRARFVMVGDGPLLGRTRALAARLGIAERLVTPGAEPRPVLALAAMDVFLSTSRVEGLPNGVIEAQAQGVPAVVTRRGGSEEAIEHGVTGWAVSADDPRALAAHVCRALADPDWTARARDRARRMARERFGRGRMVAETAALYGAGPGGGASC